jgi:hypothetical protein
MKRLTSLFVLAGLAAMPVFASAESYNGVSVVDVNCSKKVAADPDSHTRACALKCSASGYGIITSDQKFLKFDAEGNKKITEALKSSKKTDHLRVNVDGDVQGDTLKVSSITLL